MKTKSFVWSLLALVLILCTVLTPALAYFTANDRADGAIPVTLGSKTEIETPKASPSGYAPLPTPPPTSRSLSVAGV